MNQKNLAIVRQQFAQCVFNHKVCEVATERFDKKLYEMNLIDFIIVVLILTCVGLQIFYECRLLIFLSTFITVFEILFLIMKLQFNFGEKVINSKNIALKYLGLRDEYKNFISDIKFLEMNEDTYRLKRDYLQSKYQILCELSPQTLRKDFIEAQRRLNTSGKDNEDFTWCDEEIDKFLPKELRSE